MWCQLLNMCFKNVPCGVFGTNKQYFHVCVHFVSYFASTWMGIHICAELQFEIVKKCTTGTAKGGKEDFKTCMLQMLKLL